MDYQQAVETSKCEAKSTGTSISSSEKWRTKQAAIAARILNSVSNCVNCLLNKYDNSQKKFQEMFDSFINEGNAEGKKWILKSF